MTPAEKVYAVMRADPDQHRRTDLGNSYRQGYAGLPLRDGSTENQKAAWRAGRDNAVDDAADFQPPEDQG